ncbi:MAG: hypothetical protein M3Y35_15375 [Actinomycetota bacterium]|nr:hypothetical protein [Actinomycetota bacterium]
MTPDGPHLGSLNAEAGLLDAVAAHLNRFETAIGESNVPEQAAAGYDPAHSCVRWCPVCRATEVLAGDRPDIADKLAGSFAEERASTSDLERTGCR